MNLGPGADSAFGLSLQEDGKPVLAGYASSNGKADWGLVRLRAGGGLDGSFSGDGVVTTAFTPRTSWPRPSDCSRTAGSSSPVGRTVRAARMTSRSSGTTPAARST